MDGYSRCSHSRVGSTLAKLRCSVYWVPQGRQAAKKVLALCAWCKRFNTRPVLLPNVASPPVPCVQFEELFIISGINFTGHLWVKEETMEGKIYLLLFTCLSNKAVHIEVVPDVSISSFFQALCNMKLNMIPLFLHGSKEPGRKYSDVEDMPLQGYW